MALAELASLHKERPNPSYRLSPFGILPEAEPMRTPMIADLIYYPVKSFAGIRLEAGAVGTHGFIWDRGAMVVTPEGEFLTQREIPRMAQVQPSFDGDDLRLTYGGLSVRIPVFEDQPNINVNIWRSKGVEAVDQGDEAAAFLSAIFGQPVRLVTMPEETSRHVDPVYAAHGESVGFADGFPFLLISQASLDDLNKRLAAKGESRIPMNRFRPNIVVNGVSAYAEDTWKRIRIGEIEFDVVKPCARCVITKTDQLSADRHKMEPLRTLGEYRMARHLGITDLQGVFFGQNLIHRGTGSIRVGANVEVLEYR